MCPDFKLSCVLFDLDGTLVDTAPDLIACLNRALNLHGFATVNSETIKPFISYGGAAMVKASLADTLTDEIRADVLKTMLDHYESNIAAHSVFFRGIEDILHAIEAQGLKWGVVTNKRPADEGIKSKSSRRLHHQRRQHGQAQTTPGTYAGSLPTSGGETSGMRLYWRRRARHQRREKRQNENAGRIVRLS